LIERSFQGLSVAIEIVRIIEELIEIGLNEVCDKFIIMHCLPGSDGSMTLAFVSCNIPIFKSGIERVVVTCQTTQLSLIDTELSVFYMYLSNNSTRYISIDNVQEMINYLPQPDRHRTEETNYSADETI